MVTYTWPFPEGTPISQPFGSNPNNGFNPAGGHTGTDFAVPPGTPVMAIAPGIVRAVGQLPEPYSSNAWWIEGVWAGNVVVIDHGPVVSVYAHLSEWRVNLGDTVNQGQVIALSGATGGASTGPHCHFETLPDGWDFTNGTYGRVNPNIYCSGYWGGITPQSIDTGGFLMALTDAEQRALYNNLDYVASAQFKADIFAGTTDLEKTARQKFHQENWATPLPNVLTGGSTAPGTEISWLPKNINTLGNLITAAITAIKGQPVAQAAPATVDVQAIAAQLAPLLNAANVDAFMAALRTQINK